MDVLQVFEIFTPTWTYVLISSEIVDKFKYSRITISLSKDFALNPTFRITSTSVTDSSTGKTHFLNGFLYKKTPTFDQTFYKITLSYPEFLFQVKSIRLSEFNSETWKTGNRISDISDCSYLFP